MFTRATTMADAFLTATAKLMQDNKGDKKVDHHTGTGHWVARRVALQAESSNKSCLIREYDKRPIPPKRLFPVTASNKEQPVEFEDVPY